MENYNRYVVVSNKKENAMTLDLNCIRDTLMVLEKHQFFYEDDCGNVCVETLALDDLHAQLTEYDKAQLYYTLCKLSEAEYIEIFTEYGDDCVELCQITSITYSGHEFLEKIRPVNIWQKSCSVLANVGSFSLSLLNDVCGTALAAAVQKLL